MASNQTRDERADPSVAKPVKRPYMTPRLTVHGTVAELTQAKIVNHPFAAIYLTAG